MLTLAALEMGIYSDYTESYLSFILKRSIEATYKFDFKTDRFRYI